MGFPSDARDSLANARRRNSLVISSPAEECVQEGVRAGLKAAAVACVATTIPTLIAVRTIPWAKANLNHTGQALVISAASIATYFITVDKTILECARRNAQYKGS